MDQVLNIKKVTGFKYTDEKGSFFEFIDRGQFNKVSLVGPDKDKLNDGDNSGLDVFVVREGYGRQADNHSIGGVTKLIDNHILIKLIHQF